MNGKAARILVVLTAIVLLWLVLAGTDDTALRAVVGVPFILLVPGYAVTWSFFPGDELELAERATLSLGLSLAIAAVGVLILHLTPWGITADSWAMLLTAVALAACLIALFRGGTRAARRVELIRLSFNLDQALILLLAGAVALGAFVANYSREVESRRVPYTDLWVLPVSNTSVQVAVRNQERAPASYRLRAEVSGATLVDDLVLSLGAGETWTRALDLTNEQTGDVNVWLFRLYVPPGECAGAVPPAECNLNDRIYRQVVLRASSRSG